jgi:hypothetical protein
MKCALCSKSETLTNFCMNCGRVYCEKDYKKFCAFCEPQQKTEPLSLRGEKLYDVLVEWISLPLTDSVGLVDFEMIPAFLLGIRGKNFPFVRSILFKNKKASTLFTRSMTGTAYPSIVAPPDSRSRYSVVQDPHNRERYLLLNLGAIEKPTDFLIDFLISFLEETNRIASAPEFDDKLNLALGECYFAFNAKIGIPFVYADENTIQFVQAFINNAKAGYVTAAAISRAINLKNLDQAERDVSYHISLVYHGFEKQKRLFVEQIIEIISYYVQLVITLESVRKFPPVHASIASQISSWKKDFKKRKPELMCFIELVDTNFQVDVSLRSSDSFADSLSKVLVTAFESISPELYDRMQEASALVLGTAFYTEKIANAEQARGPFGNTEQFLMLLERILARNPRAEIELTVRWGLLQILITAAQGGDESAYVRALSHVEKFVDSLENRLGSLRMTNRRFPLTYEDGGVALLVFSQIAWLYGDSQKSASLRDAAMRLAISHKITSTLIHCYWSSYLDTCDVLYLYAVRRILLDENDPKFRKEDLTTQVIWMLSASVVDATKSPLYLDMAEKAAIEIISDRQPGGTVHVLTSQMTSELLALVVGLFKAVFTLIRNQSESAVDQLRSHASAILQLRELCPEAALALRSIVLHDVLTNHPNLQASLDELSKLGSASQEIWNFTHAIHDFIQSTTPGDRIAATYKYKLNTADPWNLVLQAYFREKIPELIDKLKPEEGLLLVEGPTDVAVLGIMRTKLGLSRIPLCPMRGYSNTPYFLASSLIVESVTKRRIPMFVILDGDVQKDELDAISSKLASNRTRCTVERLPEGTIEEYLLVPEAIKRAFPEIRMTEGEVASVILAGATERDKKKVIQAVFDAGGIQVMYRPEVAAKIASAMRPDEIRPDLVQLLRKSEDFLRNDT